MARIAGWRRAVAEFSIVVVGVAAALAADSWREGQGDRELEAEYRERLRDELLEGRERLLEVDARFDRVREAASNLVDVLEAGEASDDLERVSETATYAAWSGSDPYQIRYDATYEELLATGNLGIIQDASLRGALVAHFRLSSEFVGVFEDVPNDYHLRFLGLVGRAPATYVSGEDALTDSQRRRLVASLTGDEATIRELRRLRALLGVVDTYFDRVLQDLDALAPLL